jgi:hypothetical protein
VCVFAQCALLEKSVLDEKRARVFLHTSVFLELPPFVVFASSDMVLLAARHISTVLKNELLASPNKAS